jgi:hypothetical protein
MNDFGVKFIETLPCQLKKLKIPGRSITENRRDNPILAKIDHIPQIQTLLSEILSDPITKESHSFAESTFQCFLTKEKTDSGVLKFFNGWNETHRTTSLVSAKLILRLSADAVSTPLEKHVDHSIVMAHMHEVAKDDFGLGHKGHDGMYPHMVAAFHASDWQQKQFTIKQCNAFSDFLYLTGISGNKLPMKSTKYINSILDAMMVSVASELWNGREYNFLAQHIEEKILSFNPGLADNSLNLRNAKGYVLSHSGEVETRHGLHALAAAQAYSRLTGLTFDLLKLKQVILDYNQRVGNAFHYMHEALRHSI